VDLGDTLLTHNRKRRVNWWQRRKKRRQANYWRQKCPTHQSWRPNRLRGKAGKDIVRQAGEEISAISL